jgi:type IV pilus assembly protein PilV
MMPTNRHFKNHLSQRPGQQSGFTLLEATIALLVLSIGMLGISALFFEGLKSGRTAVYRTEAVYLASDMADRIRANPLAGAAYEQDGANEGCHDDAATCTPQQVAREDKLEWAADMAEHMPADSTATVNVADNGVTTVYTIVMTWPEPGFAAPLNYSLVVER